MQTLYCVEEEDVGIVMLTKVQIQYLETGPNITGNAYHRAQVAMHEVVMKS